MPRLESLSPKYSLEQSPLFCLKTRRRLAALLYWNGSASSLEQFAKRPDNYKVFEISEEGKKPRTAQVPKDALEAIHRRLAVLLLRVSPPTYLHSGLRGRSFVTNGRCHVNDMPAIKLDVKKFYPSTKWDHVFRFFRSEMQCSPDVAGLLATLACYKSDLDSHLPTGSCLSQVLAYFAHRQMFDQIYSFAKRRGGEMTVYVDDIMISMPNASSMDISRVGRMVTRQGLEWHKDRFFPRGVAKRVTGTIAKRDRLQADKRQHWKYRKTLDRLDDPNTSDVDRQKVARSAIGMLQSIAQIDRRFSPTARGMSEHLRPLTVR